MRFPLAIVVCSVAAAPAWARDVAVTSTQELGGAIQAAQPGDVILLAPGEYTSGNITCSANGTENQPIVVKPSTPRAAHLLFNGLEGFKVQGAHWHFEDLHITGICSSDPDCEHAFHVTGAADGFVMRGNRVEDFNAQLKVNAAQVGGSWRAPNGGLIEGNDLGDTRPRATSSPVTKLNIDTGDDWVVRGNVIHDFHKNGGNQISYGAFMKSGGQRGIFERNLVLCTRDVDTGGVRIGLSFGGGGTAPQFCAPAFDAQVPCSVEHSDGIMRNNIIVNCSDVGIYINRGANSRVLFNTLIGTTGVDFRFDTTSGNAVGNLLEGRIRARDDGTFNATDNREMVPSADFTTWYAEPLQGDLQLAGDVSTLQGAAAASALVVDDYCGRTRPTGVVTVGALEHSLGSCETTQPPDGMMRPDAGPQADAGVAPPADAGTPDAAPVSTDGGAVGAPQGDAGTSTDAAPGPCACSDARTQRGAWPAFILMVLGLLRRRRDSPAARAP